MAQIMPKFHLACQRRGALCKGINCTATAGVALLIRQKCPKAIQGCALKTPRTGTPARKVYDLPERGLNGAYKVSATHFYRPALERGRANHHPCPLL